MLRKKTTDADEMMQLEGIHLVSVNMLKGDEKRNSRDRKLEKTLMHTREEHYYKKIALNISKLRRLIKHANPDFNSLEPRYGHASSVQELPPSNELSPAREYVGNSVSKFLGSKYEAKAEMLRIKNQERHERVQENKHSLSITAERDKKSKEKRKTKLEAIVSKNRKIEEAERKATLDEKLAKYDEKMKRKDDLQAAQIRKSMRAFRQQLRDRSN